MKKVIFLFMAVVAFVLVANQVYANSILSLVLPGPNQASDENREYLIDRTYGTPGAEGFGVIGQIDVGDAFRGSININTINSGSANVGGLTGNNEFSGILQVVVTGKVGIDLDPLTPGFEAYALTFGPDPLFAGTIVGGHVVEAGAIAVLFEDATPDYTGDFNDPKPTDSPPGVAIAPPADPDPIPLTGAALNAPLDDGTGAGPRTVPPSSADVSLGPYATEEAFVATAVDGQWRLTLGFLGLPGEGGSALQTGGPGQPADNILGAFNFTSGSTFANANFGLNVIAQDPTWPIIFNRVVPSIFPLGVGGLVDFAASQETRGVGDLDTPFEISTNTNMSFNATVPEPATLLLLGAGLVGLAGAARRRMKR